jgi:hypothetical protein
MVVAMRSIEWSFRFQPYLRKLRQDSMKRCLGDFILDALDISFNLRGNGWDWGQNCVLESTPPLTRSFLLDTVLRIIYWFSLFDCVLSFIRVLDLNGTSFDRGLFEGELVSPLLLVKSTFITFLAGVCVYSGISSVYHICTLFGILFCGQSRYDWPAIFNSPWQAVSLTDFWGRRWHQIFRRNFLVMGGKPLYAIFGKLGGLIGVFMISAIMHDFPMWGMGQGMEFYTVGGYFLIQGLGMVIESVLLSLLGVTVKGPCGRVWTAVWVIIPGNLVIDAWFRRGLAACVFLPDPIRITRVLRVQL